MPVPLSPLANTFVRSPFSAVMTMLRWPSTLLMVTYAPLGMSICNSYVLPPIVIDGSLTGP